MRLDDLDPSDNVRDLGSGSSGGGGFPLLGLLPMLLGRGKLGCGTIALLLVVGAFYLFAGGLGGGGTTATAPSNPGGATTGSAVCSTPERLFSCRVLASTEQTWGRIFQESGQSYTPATLSFYQGGAQSGCGAASSAMGPFYCPSDQGVYLDTAFFDELGNRFGAKGDFAEAYVIAHEVGHHIQQLLGASEKVQSQMQRSSSTDGNALSVRLELQADCYAGVWAARNKDRLEPGDVEEGMTAANAIGDDTLQKQSQGSVVPDSFTHGSSAARMKWLKVGLDSGDPARCDTFSGSI